MRMLIRFTSFIAFLTVLLYSCNHSYHNRIVFSCIHCPSCIESALAYIENNELDNNYNIILDTNCIKRIYDIERIKYSHMDQDAIFRKYGRFGNYALYDSVGVKTVFNSDMHLKNVIGIKP